MREKHNKTVAFRVSSFMSGLSPLEYFFGGPSDPQTMQFSLLVML